MIRTFCRCLVKFDDIQPTKQWTEKQIPEIVRRYSQHFVEAQTLKDIWWEEFIDVETISKVRENFLNKITYFLFRSIFIVLLGLYWLYHSGSLLVVRRMLFL